MATKKSGKAAVSPPAPMKKNNPPAVNPTQKGSAKPAAGMKSAGKTESRTAGTKPAAAKNVQPATKTPPEKPLKKPVAAAPAKPAAPEKNSAKQDKNTLKPKTTVKPAPASKQAEVKPTSTRQQPQKPSSAKEASKKTVPEAMPKTDAIKIKTKPSAKPKTEAPPSPAPAPVKPSTDSASKWSEIREILLRMKVDTLQEITKTLKNGTNTPLVGDPSGDIYDQASSERDRELGLLLGDRDREKLHNIDEALFRMDDNEYGICEECEEDIPVGRLKVMPFTRYCVRCKEGIEREQAQTRRFEEDRAYREIPLGVEDEDI